MKKDWKRDGAELLIIAGIAIGLWLAAFWYFYIVFQATVIWGGVCS